MAFLKCAMVAAIGTDVSSRFHPAGTIELHGGCGLTVVVHGRAFSRQKRRFGKLDNLEGNEVENSCLSRARGACRSSCGLAPPTSNNPCALCSASMRLNPVLAWGVRAFSGKDLDGNGRRPIC